MKQKRIGGDEGKTGNLTFHYDPSLYVNGFYVSPTLEFHYFLKPLNAQP